MTIGHDDFNVASPGDQLPTVEAFPLAEDDQEFDASSASIDHVVDVALESFATLGFKDTRLKSISLASGMSKRMIHYHFGDKKGLYIHVIQRAIANMRPEVSEKLLRDIVPVEGMRIMTEAIYDQISSNPLSARLLVMESQHNYASMNLAGPFADQSVAMLQMERLLMLGQDSGAFRPGISVIDIYTVIIALTLMRPTYHAAYSNLYNVNLLSMENTEGMRQLAVDTVLSFLTSNLAPRKGMSYLVTDMTHDPSAPEVLSAADDVYTLSDSPYDDQPDLQ